MGTPGPKRKLTQIQLTQLATIALSLVHAGAPYSVGIMRAIACRTLAPTTVSLEWTGLFLLETGLVYRRTCTADAVKFTESQAAEKESRLRLIKHWLMQEKHISLNYVWKMDV